MHLPTDGNLQDKWLFEMVWFLRAFWLFGLFQKLVENSATAFEILLNYFEQLRSQKSKKKTNDYHEFPKFYTNS